MTGELPLPPRQVTLLLCDRDGTLLGVLPPFEVALPWWQEVADVVGAPEWVNRTAGSRRPFSRAEAPGGGAARAVRTSGRVRHPGHLVHGDFHTGNARGSAAQDGRTVLPDWGDCAQRQALIYRTFLLRGTEPAAGARADTRAV